jgi:hypothetical protein
MTYSKVAGQSANIVRTPLGLLGGAQEILERCQHVRAVLLAGKRWTWYGE